MPVTTKDGLLEAWAEQLETLEQNLEALYGPPGITPELPSVTNNDGMLEAIADDTEKSAWYFAKVYNATVTDSVEKYIATVPSTALYCTGLVSIGGKTIVWNQLVDSETASVTLANGRKYYTLINGTENIVAGDGSDVSVSGGADMVCDLTLMFGLGNEPGSVAAFKEVFPNPILTYNEGELLSAEVDSVVSKDSAGNVLDTYVIPDDIKEIEGYGWSAGSAYNYVDFENKKFVKNVERIDLGTITYSMNGSFTDASEFLSASAYLTDRAYSRTNIITPKFALYESLSGYHLNTMYGRTNSGRISFFWTLGETAANFKTYLDGQYLYYELSTPVETDISSYIDSNLIKVVPGGTLTFVNKYGHDYRIPVPVQMENIGV